MLKRLIFWDFARGSWQYDLVVGMILAFIFLTPRAWFRDQPRVPHASSIQVLEREVFWLEPELLHEVPPSEHLARLSSILSSNFQKKITVTKVDAILDSEGSLKGYLALTRP